MSAAVGSKLSARLETITSPEDGVQIWIANLDAIVPNELEELGTLLSSAERARATRFHFPRDERRFTARRGLLRGLLAEHLSVPAAAVEFSHTSHGKPEVAPSRDGRVLRFNLSHAAGFAIFALAWDRELGIDLESSTRLAKPTDDLASRILSPSEFATWRALADDEARASALLRAWVRKEACSKATGEGLSAELQEIEVAFDPALTFTPMSSRAKATTRRKNSDWMLYDLAAPAGFAAAIAVEQRKA